MSRPSQPFSPAARPEGPRINQGIHAQTIRLIGSEGEMIGVVSLGRALDEAMRLGLDLVEISPQADPPVCKILDYGKYKYELQKKKAEARKNQKVVEIKEVQVRPMIDENDFEVKCRAIQRFLSEGNKVKISLRFRGREMSHQEYGMKVLKRIQAQFIELAKVENMPKLEGRQVIMVLAPKVI